MLFKEGAKAPFMDRTFVSVDEMIVVLRSQMGPGIVKGKSMQVDWQLGIGYGDNKRRSPLRDILRSSVGDSGSSDLMAIRNRVLDEIDRLAEAYPGRVYCDHKKNAAQLKRVGSTEAFLEVRFGPHDVSKYPKGYIVRRDRALRSLAVPVDVKKRFAAYCGRELGDTQGFIRAAEQLIGYF